MMIRHGILASSHQVAVGGFEISDINDVLRIRLKLNETTDTDDAVDSGLNASNFTAVNAPSIETGHIYTNSRGIFDVNNESFVNSGLSIGDVSNCASVWVKFPVGSSGERYLGSWFGGGDDAYLWRIRGAREQEYIAYSSDQPGGETFRSTAVFVPDDNDWHMISWSKEVNAGVDSDIRLWIDTNEVSYLGQTDHKTQLPSNAVIEVGALAGFDDRSADCHMQDFKHWYGSGAVLNTQKIADLFGPGGVGLDVF